MPCRPHGGGDGYVSRNVVVYVPPNLAFLVCCAKDVPQSGGVTLEVGDCISTCMQILLAYSSQICNLIIAMANRNVNPLEQLPSTMSDFHPTTQPWVASVS